MKLTDRKRASGASLTDLIHVVLTGDTTQNSAGSSYKIEMGAYKTLFTPISYWTAGTSGTYSMKALNDSGINATGNYAVAEGFNTQAIGHWSHAEGWGSSATGMSTHAEGYFTQSWGDYSHSEGLYTVASGESSHASGAYSTAGGNYSFVHGYNSIVYGNYSIVLGRDITAYNADTTYVDNLNIKSTSGIAVKMVGLDASGKVVSVENLQRTITSTTTISNFDNNYTLIIDNGANPINIIIPDGLIANINVGFIQQGTGDVTFLPLISGGVEMKSPLNYTKIKGVNYNAYIEQVGTSNVYHLLGNLKV